jgi:hypothetical protein
MKSSGAGYAWKRVAMVRQRREIQAVGRQASAAMVRID